MLSVATLAVQLLYRPTGPFTGPAMAGGVLVFGLAYGATCLAIYSTIAVLAVAVTGRLSATAAASSVLLPGAALQAWGLAGGAGGWTWKPLLIVTTVALVRTFATRALAARLGVFDARKGPKPATPAPRPSLPVR